MENYKTLSAKEAADLLLSADKPLIVMHARPDGDTVGTASALSKLLRMLGKEPKLACQDPIPEKLRFLIEGEEIIESFDGMAPIAVDVASRSQIGRIYDSLPRVLLSIDHHSIAEPFSDNYTKDNTASAAEVLMDIIDVLSSRGLVSMSGELAEPLYAAISSDTGCFCFSSVSADTHRRAAELISLGIDFADINHRLFHSKPLCQLKAESYVAANIKLANDGRVGYVTISKNERDALGIKPEHFECAIDIVRSLSGIDVSFVVKESDEGIYRVSLRSLSKEVSRVAKAFGGGGHKRAAGCAITAPDIHTVSQKILEEISKLF